MKNERLKEWLHNRIEGLKNRGAVISNGTRNPNDIELEALTAMLEGPTDEERQVLSAVRQSSRRSALESSGAREKRYR